MGVLLIPETNPLKPTVVRKMKQVIGECAIGREICPPSLSNTNRVKDYAT
jgi:hypothetical protein